MTVKEQANYDTIASWSQLTVTPDSLLVNETKTNNAPKVIAIDGITRSGKFWLAEVLTHLESVDVIIHEPILDLIVQKVARNLLAHEIAEDLIGNMVGYRCFSAKIGRNLNSRIADSSSIKSHPEYLAIQARSESIHDQEFENNKQIHYQGEFFPLICHDWLALSTDKWQPLANYKSIRIERNPIDLVYAWFATGIGRGEMAFSHRVRVGNLSVPWFAESFAGRFSQMTDMERICESICYLFEHSQKKIEEHRKRGVKIFVTKYELLGADLSAEMERLCRFLGTKKRSTAEKFIRSQNAKLRGERQLAHKRMVRMQQIRAALTDQHFRRLEIAAECYEHMATGL